MQRYTRQNDRQELNILIGKNKYWEYVFLEDAFKHSDWFKWLTWTIMEFHTEDEYEQAKENYIDSWDLKYLRKEAVANDSTEESYEDWKQEVIDEDDQLVYDTSYRTAYRIDDALKIIDEHEYEETWVHATSEFSNCVWWWRCFDEEMLRRNYRERVDEKNFKTFKKLFIEYEC